MIRPVKAILLAMLMLWFGLQTGWAQVHAAQDSAHALVHAVDGTPLDHGSPADGDEGCGLTHCSHTVGLLRAPSLVAAGPVSTGQTARAENWRALVLPPVIERPKWALTTPAVVSL